jgi:two-component system, OmpR family, phosphate regulon sensor histidine kinase PhoR
MSETSQSTAGRRIAGLIRAKLSSAGWMLAASALAILVVGLAAEASMWLIAAAILFVLGVAAVAPRRARRTSNPEPNGLPSGVALKRLTAIDMAAAVPEALIVFDRSGAVLHANAAARSAFGELPTGLMLRMRFRTPEMQQLVTDALEGAEPPSAIEYVERVPVERAFRVAAMPIGREAGVFALVFRDQSEARRIDRMRADFIANASHELRTPLASISGFIETLRGPARDDAAARENFLQIMQDQTERMARLIDDLLSLSRLEMRTHMRPATPVELGGLLAQVIEALGHMAAEAGVRVETDLGAAPLEVPGNRDELFQVFQNLLENAIKYGAAGGRVEIGMSRGLAGETPEVRISIRDYGPGIAAEHIPRVTERFYRVDVETSRAQKGTGLGLAIVKHILSRHDGRLSIESAPGEGAVFAVHLPEFQQQGARADA